MMRAVRIAGLLMLAASLFAEGAPATAAAPWAGGSSIAAVLPAPAVLAQATPAPAPAPAKPSQRPAEFDYLPRDDGRGGAREIGWLLIAAAIVLAIVIVVFVVRHRRTGRPG
jgi:hypothetical protein